MKPIEKRGGKIFYGDCECADVDCAYDMFREDYHKSIGRVAFKRLDRLGQRVDRIRGFGFVFDYIPSCREELISDKLTYRILGLTDISYGRIFGVWDIPDMEDDEFEGWFDRVFMKNSGLLRLVGRNIKTGRTSKLLKQRINLND